MFLTICNFVSSAILWNSITIFIQPKHTRVLLFFGEKMKQETAKIIRSIPKWRFPTLQMEKVWEWVFGLVRLIQSWVSLNSLNILWFNTTDTQNSAELEFGLTGWLWQLYYPQEQPTPPGGFGNDPRLGVVALRAQGASREDSYPQVIFKFHRPTSLD